MKLRNVLALDPQGYLSGQLSQLAAEDQIFHCVDSVAAASRLLAKNACSVGLVIFDNLSPLHQDDVERMIVSAPSTEWIAVLAPQLLAAKPFQAFVLNAFHDYHTLPIDPLRLAMTIGHACGKARLRIALGRDSEDAGRFGICAASPAMMNFLAQLEKVLDTNLPVLIIGESGTGKELVARAIHHYSARSDKPFIVVNCGAIPAQLIQSELFGHEKGAFTGANQRSIGKIEAANGGVLFLDEIGDLQLDLQTNLLRVLQEHTITRIGGSQGVGVDFRLVAATHVDLQEAIRAGHFREDLYYRLNVIQLQLPPLRERRGDVHLLAENVLRNYLASNPKCQVTAFSAEAIRAMNAHDWPGNVRELINRVHRAIIMSDGRLVGAADLGLETLALGPPSVTLEAARASFDRDIVEASLRSNDNNVTKAAQQLGISRVTLYRIMNRLNISSSIDKTAWKLDTSP